MKKRKPKRKEVKRFRSEKRACRLGEGKTLQPCKKPTCWLCKAIRTNFKTSLRHKRDAVRNNAKCVSRTRSGRVCWLSPISVFFSSWRNRGGIRFGGGVYMAPSSNKYVRPPFRAFRARAYDFTRVLNS